MRNLYKVLSEKYLLVNEQEEKTGDVTPDGESTLKIDKSGAKFWRNKQGEFHRRDGPAIKETDGSKEWWVNGEKHRLDGPAIEWPDGSKAWYVNDKLHCLDGPAVDYVNGFKKWYIDGVNYSYEDWKKEVQHRKNLADIHKKGSEDSGLNISALTEKKEKTGDVTPDGESTLLVDRVGNKFWLNKQKLFKQYHRRDGPAIEWTNGNRQWWIDGKRHRLDGPAIELASGYKAWYVNDKRHRLDGPAVENASGYKEWYIDGKEYNYKDWKKEVQHRKNLADIHKKGSEDSGLNLGALNEQEEKTGDVSPDGESTLKIEKGGAKVWRNKQGQLHRRDGPAVEEVYGAKLWFVNDKLHRLDGPAIEHPDGDKLWWIEDRQYSYEDWKKEVEHRKKLAAIYKKGSEDSGLNIGALTEQEEKTGDVSSDGESTLTIDKDGGKIWLNKQGKLHRREGPAFEYANGSKEWWVNGKLHRLDGPAVEYAEGYKEWYVNGKLHRLDGPAIEDANGFKEWYIDEVEYSYKDWKKEAEHRKKLAAIHKKGSEDSGLNISALSEQKEKEGDVSPDGESTLKIDMYGRKYWYNKNSDLHRRNGPAIEYTNGNKYWFINGKSHRLDGPAVEYANGSKEWWVNGKLHRLDGPAVEYANGSKEWWIDDVEYSYNDWRKEVQHRKKLAAIHKKGSEDSGLNIGALTEQEEKNGDVSPDGESTLKMYINGDKFWRNKQGHYHRLDGPAIEWADGDKQWWINGIQYSYEDWKKEVEHRKNLDNIYSKGKEVDLNLKGFNA